MRLKILVELSLVVAGRAADRRLVFFLAVAADTPAHRKRRVLIHHFHRLNRPVTLVAGLRRTVLFDVALVIEAHVIWQHVHLLPRNWRVVVVRLGKLLNVGPVGRNNQVTVHADVETWHGRMIRAFSRGMAVQTLHLVLSSMKLVRERNRLLGRVALVVSNRTPLATGCEESEKSHRHSQSGFAQNRLGKQKIPDAHAW